MLAVVQVGKISHFFHLGIRRDNNKKPLQKISVGFPVSSLTSL